MGIELCKETLIEPIICPKLSYQFRSRSAHISNHRRYCISRRYMDQNKIQNDDGQQQDHRVNRPVQSAKDYLQWLSAIGKRARTQLGVLVFSDYENE